MIVLILEQVTVVQVATGPFNSYKSPLKPRLLVGFSQSLKNLMELSLSFFVILL